VALHTNNNTTIKKCGSNNKTMITTMTKETKKKGKEKKMKRSPMKAFPLDPRSSLITHGKRNG